MSDLETIELKEGVDPDEVPVAPHDIEDFMHPALEMLGGVRVNDTSDDGVWSLHLEVRMAAHVFGATVVDERLEPGTYALVRVKDDRPLAGP